LPYRYEFYSRRLLSIARQLVVPVCIAGVAFRLAGLGASALWYDEAFSLYMTRLPLLQMVRTSFTDFNPPLWEIVLWPIVRLLGETELALRLPALAASLVGLWLTYKLACHFDPLDIRWRAGGLALAALLPYQFWLAQDGRVYALMSALYLGAAWFALQRHWAGFVACTGLLMFSHTSALFYALPLLAVAALSMKRNQWPWLAGSVTVIAAVLALWLPSAMSTQDQFWLGPFTGGQLLAALVRIFFADTLPFEGWVFLAVITIAASVVAAAAVTITALRRCDRSSALLGLLAVGPLVLMVAAAITYKNIVFYRPLSAMLAPLCLWFGYTLSRTWRPLRWVLAYNWTLLIIVGLIGWSPAARGGELRDLAQMIESQWQPGDVIYHATGTSFLPFQFYLSGKKPAYLLDEPLPSGLLRQSLQDAFGIERRPLHSIIFGRAWVIYARDELVSKRALTRMEAYTAKGTLMGTVHTWQAAPIEVYLVQP